MLTILLILLAIPGLVLFVPWHAAFEGGWDRHWRGSVRLSWLWGAVAVAVAWDTTEVPVHLRLLGRTMKFKPRQTGKEPGPKKPASRKRAKRSNGRSRPFPFSLSDLASLLRSVRALARELAPRGRLSVVCGLGDPADTGRLLGVVQALTAALRLPVSLRPDFESERFSAHGELRLRLRLFRLLALCTALLLSEPGRKMIKRSREGINEPDKRTA